MIVCLKICHAFAENYLMNFCPKLALILLLPQIKTQFLLSQKT